jgi:hypothetical protein
MALGSEDIQSLPSSNLVVSVSSLPSGDIVELHDSTYFSNGKKQKLPSPTEIRLLAEYQYRSSPPPIRYPQFNLLVKYGLEITPAEGQCLWAVRHFLPNTVPVPEIYGWHKDGDECFIYMELKHGQTLEQRWPVLNERERIGICKQLHDMVASLHMLQQNPADRFIGK